MRSMHLLKLGLATALLPSAVSAQETTATYLDRIAKLDQAGPRINAVITTTPDRPVPQPRIGGPLAGKAVLVKDNIETQEFPTTAGSLALAGNRTGRDAPLIARLRMRGVYILGKTNLSEWANIRSSTSTSGWSAVGGQTRNPHAIDRNPCGSSSGSGAAVAAGFAWAAIGTETDGSITCPASVNGVVGFKPTVGLVSRTHIVPISRSQDTAGPLAASVEDAALLLTAMAGSDPADPATAAADAHQADFAEGLASASLKGVRIGVLRKQVGGMGAVGKLFEQALGDLGRAGAVLVDVDYDIPEQLGKDENTVLQFELREGMDAYLKGLPGAVKVRSLADVIAFDKVHAATEMRWFGQDTFEQAEQATDLAAYQKARAASLQAAGRDGIDKLLAANHVALLIAPTAGPAWTTDPVNGDHFVSGIGAGTLPAVAGYPHLSVPMGAVEGLPVGLSFIAAKWADKAVLEAGAAYERARSAKLAAPTFKPWAESADGR